MITDWSENGIPTGCSCLILIGLSGVGKSTLIRRLSTDYGYFRAVNRWTTRRPRPDDDMSFVTTVPFIDPRDSRRFIYPGWGADLYALDPEEINANGMSGIISLVELGDPETAVRLRNCIGTAKIVRVLRDLPPAQLEEVIRVRGMPDEDAIARLETYAEDVAAMEACTDLCDLTVNNTASLEDITMLAQTVHFFALSLGGVAPWTQ